MTGWLKSIGSQILYEFDHTKPVLYVISIDNILGKLPVVPEGDTGTIPYHLLNFFPGAPCDSRPGAGDGCRMWSSGFLLTYDIVCQTYDILLIIFKEEDYKVLDIVAQVLAVFVCCFLNFLQESELTFWPSFAQHLIFFVTLNTTNFARNHHLLRYGVQQPAQ